MKPSTAQLGMLAAGVLLVSACSDDSVGTTTTTPPITTLATTTQPATTTTVATATTDATTTTLAAQEGGQIATSPAPASYTEVQDEFEAASASILGEGRAVAGAFVSGGVGGVHALFDENMASAVSLEDLRKGRLQIEAEGALGAPIAERAVPLGPAIRGYQADLPWGDGVLGLSAVFDANGRITTLLLTPRFTLAEDPAGDHESSLVYRLPFDGLWFVAWGGRTELQNYHVVAPDQRHALDLVVWKDGATHTGDGTDNADYWAYGQPVLAPANGTVVTVVDGLPDQTPQLGSDPSNPAGNHVVIEVAEGEYVLIAHLQPDSIVVAEGDVVASGQQLALVGNSGNTSEPHIHIHAQDQPTFGQGAVGLPIAFTGYSANGEPVAEGEVLADQFVANG